MATIANAIAAYANAGKVAATPGLETPAASSGSSFADILKGAAGDALGALKRWWRCATASSRPIKTSPRCRSERARRR